MGSAAVECRTERGGEPVAVGLIVAGGVVPVALLAYWECSSSWTLGQAAVIRRWFPTPGSPAAGRAG